MTKNHLIKTAKLGAVAVTAALVIAQPALADPILTGAEITAAADGSGANESLKSGALWALGLTIATVVVARVLGLIRK